MAGSATVGSADAAIVSCSFEDMAEEQWCAQRRAQLSSKIAERFPGGEVWSAGSLLAAAVL